MSAEAYVLMAGGAAIVAVFLFARWMVPALIFVLTALTIITLDQTGLFKPAWMEWRRQGEAEVLGAHFEPGEAIYVILATRGGPRCYEVPWSARLAREYRAVLEGQEGILMVRPFAWEAADDTEFRTSLRPSLPEKPQ